jgi:hypothetical protein
MWFLCDKVVSDLWHVGGFFRELRLSTNKTGRIKLTVTKQEVYSFISTVIQAIYQPLHWIQKIYLGSVKLHDSATYDDRRKSYEWLKH